MQDFKKWGLFWAFLRLSDENVQLISKVPMTIKYVTAPKRGFEKIHCTLSETAPYVEKSFLIHNQIWMFQINLRTLYFQSALLECHNRAARGFNLVGWMSTHEFISMRCLMMLQIFKKYYLKHCFNIKCCNQTSSVNKSLLLFVLINKFKSLFWKCTLIFSFIVLTFTKKIMLQNFRRSNIQNLPTPLIRHYITGGCGR